MNRYFPIPVLCLLLLSFAASACADEPAVVRHAIDLKLVPTSHRLVGIDSVLLAEPALSLHFYLHRELQPQVSDAGVTLSPAAEETELAQDGTEGMDSASGEEGLRHWQLRSTEPRELWVIHFTGELFQDVSNAVFGHESVGAEIRATVSEQGIYLSGGAGWYPLAEDGLHAHRVSTTLPEGWRSLTQGRKILEHTKNGWTRTTWDAPKPSEGVNLVAGRFRVDSRQHGQTLVETYFFPEDSSLAAGYLDACVGYLDLYESFLSPYPYAKFAVVENFFPTGYGMPSWTLLGQVVLRLPFIKHSSLGHEIAHNWWGNSVFVGEGGNWCEGITVYTADYLYKERESAAAARQYRKNTLKSYTHYTRDGGDFPLTEFVSRHNPATRAVGYGKSMMIFHMLEELVGRERFRAALRRVIAEKQWTAATWSDFFHAVEQEGGFPDGTLEKEREQWIEKTGAAMLSLGQASVREEGEGWLLSVELKQEGEPLILHVPIHVETEGRAEDFRVELSRARQNYELRTAARPIALSVDPDYHIFRRLHGDEIEATLSLIMADTDPLFVLADGATGELEEAFRDFAAAFIESDPRIVRAAAFDGEARTVIWLGTKPPTFRDAPAGLQVTPLFTVFQGERLEPGGHSLIYTGKRGEDGGFMAVLSDKAGEVHAIARKVPHYGKYSYLAFSGGRNCLKGNWEAAAGPLYRRLD